MNDNHDDLSNNSVNNDNFDDISIICSFDFCVPARSAMSRGMYHPHFPPALTHMTAAMGGMGAMGATLPAHTPSDYQATLDSEKVRAAFLPTSLGEFDTSDVVHALPKLSLDGLKW